MLTLLTNLPFLALQFLDHVLLAEGDALTRMLHHSFKVSTELQLAPVPPITRSTSQLFIESNPQRHAVGAAVIR